MSCLAMVEGPDWWCWPQKWGDGGARRPPSSSPPWPRHARCPFRRFCKVGSRRAWIRWWSAILACSAARAVSLSLLDQRPVPQVCEIPSAHEVLRDDRFTKGRVSSFVGSSVALAFLLRLVVHSLLFPEIASSLFRVKKKVGVCGVWCVVCVVCGPDLRGRENPIRVG